MANAPVAKTLAPKSILCEVEFTDCCRIGSTVFNGPTETKHADNSVTRHPADKAGLPEELANVVVEKNLGRILRRGADIPDTLGIDKDPWADGRQLGLSELITRVMRLEQENAELKAQVGRKN